jgi:hypothetical protein
MSIRQGPELTRNSPLALAPATSQGPHELDPLGPRPRIRVLLSMMLMKFRPSDSSYELSQLFSRKVQSSGDVSYG